jgi:uncharacterized protein with von Willebrand factor type A (vWA) domain
MNISPTPETLLTRTLELCRLAKAAKLNVTQSRVIDAFRSLQSVQWQNEDEVRFALRINLVSSHEEEETFDRIFAAYWHGSSDEGDKGARLQLRTELVRGEFDLGFQESHQELLDKPTSFSDEDMVRELNLTARWDAEAPPIEQIIRELAKRLATRPSRRLQPASQGRRIDLRRSLRRNVRHGIDMVELARVERRVRKTRIVMLCDVSGSMDAFNPFLLQLMFGLQKELKNSRTVVFSTRTSEITSLLRCRSVQHTLREISEHVRHWSGGTDIGGALAELNRSVLHEGSIRSTVAIIISDGYDNGEPDVIEREMKALRRRVRTVVWINPMYGAQTFTVRASGMRAAMPYIDYFLPAFNVQSLRVLVRELARV